MPRGQEQQKTLYRSLSLFTMGLLLLAGTLQFLLLFPAWQLTHLAATQKRNLNLAQEVANRLEPLYAGTVGWKLQQEIYRFSRQNPNTSLFLLDSTGAILADYAQGSPELRSGFPHSVIDRFELAKESDVPIMGPNPLDGKEKQLYSLAPLRVRDEPFWVYLALDSETSRTTYNILREGFAFAAAGGGILLATGASGLLAAVVLFLVTRRFSRMTNVVREFAGGVFEQRLEVSSREDELDEHAATLNRMAGRIQADVAELKERDQTRRRLIQAVSGDLSGLMQEMDTALEALEADTVREDTGPAALLLRQSNSLSLALEELFELARIESKDSVPHFEEFSLEQLVDDVLMAKAEQANERRIAVRLIRGIAPAAAVLGDIRWIAEAITVTLEELILSSPSGSRIDIFTQQQSGHLETRFALQREAEGAAAARRRESSLRLAIITAKLKAHRSELRREQVDERTSVVSFSLPLASREARQYGA